MKKKSLNFLVILAGVVCALICSSASKAGEPAPVPSGLVGWWTGEGSGGDLLGLNPGIPIGGLMFQPGLVGQAFAFDGVNAALRIPASRLTDAGQNEGFTVEFWAKPTFLNIYQPMIEWDQDSNYFGAKIWASYPSAIGNIFSDLISTTGPRDNFFETETKVFTAGSWSHVALTYDKTTGQANAYVNGTNVQTAVFPNLRLKTMGDLFLGMERQGLGTRTVYWGLLDEVSLYQRALSSAEVTQIFTAGAAGKAHAAAPVIKDGPTAGGFAAGTNFTLSVTAGGLPSPSFQWLKDGLEIAGATGANLVVSNAVPKDSGGYAVVVSNASGSVMSGVAQVKVEWRTSFATVISSVSESGGRSISPAWGDFDGDGAMDLFVSNYYDEGNFLFRGSAAHTFQKVTGTAVSSGGKSEGAAWGDYDNDGKMDLFVANDEGENDFLFHNDGGGVFTKRSDAAVSQSGGNSRTGVWADYDQDGFLDLFVPHDAGATNALYHNNGNGTFSAITSGQIVTDKGWSRMAAWGDYDNDGYPDLFVANGFGGSSFLYHNEGNGSFSRVTTGPIATDTGAFWQGVWGDFDNDGDLDLAVSSDDGSEVRLYRNDGAGVFTLIPSAFPGSSNGYGLAWGDLDKNGYLDLVVTGLLGSNQQNCYYRNNGSGTFTRITDPVVSGPDVSVSQGVALADYDHDGNLDIVIANSGNEFLYRNVGNGASYLGVLAKNIFGAPAIGAKVRITATLDGKTVRQLREISGGTGMGQDAQEAFFGLSDTTNIVQLRIEWPSGRLTEMSNVQTNQFLTVDEGAALISPLRPAVGLGDTMVLQGSSTLAGTLLYQWELNGAAIAGATNSYLVVKGAKLMDAGEYRMRVRSGGMEVSGLVTLAVGRALTDGLVAQWSFEGDYKDQSGFGNNGTPGSLLGFGDGVNFVQGVLGRGLHFHNAWLDVQPSASLNVGQGDGFTISLWVKPDSFENNSVLISWQRDTTHQPLALWTSGAGSFPDPPQPPDFFSGLATVVEGGTVRFTPQNHVLEKGVYQHIATAYDRTSGTIRLYRNGLLVDEAVIGNVVAWSPVASVKIGTDPTFPSSYPFAGTMDELKVYSRALSEDEIRAEIGRTNINLQLTITNQPVGATVGVGGTVALSVGAQGFGTLSFQWLKDGVEIAGATNTTFTILNAQPGNAGSYSVRVKNVVREVASDGAPVEVLTTFGRVSADVIGATMGGSGSVGSVNWIDFDNDGFLDLFNANRTVINFFRNNGDGTFARITTRPLVTEGGNTDTSVWADFDNDGNIDAVINKPGAAGAAVNDVLFRNNGDGSFLRLPDVLNDGLGTYSGAWGDFDNDGLVDLFLPSSVSGNHLLYRNLGNGSFTLLPAGTLSAGAASSSGTWGDFDGDGDLDLFVTSLGLSTLHRNDGNGVFTAIRPGPLATASADAQAGAWGDFDNDGFLDLAVAAITAPALLFHNDGHGSFTQVTSGPVATDVHNGVNCVWGDYDNDGWLDLFIVDQGGGSTLYRNNGDGSFSRSGADSLNGDIGAARAASWGDFNRDGFIDLAVIGVGTPNRLYRNNGNSNAWLHVRCVGVASNRSAIGAKVRVLATYGGHAHWQLREVSGGTGWGEENLECYFGLGDATNVTEVRVEWPSGVVTELKDVAVNQLLRIEELPEGYPVVRMNGQFSPTNYFGFTNGAAVTVTISSSFPEVHYTVDGSEPNVFSPTYSGPLQVTPGVTINAVAYTENYDPSEVVAIRTEQVPYFTLTNLNLIFAGGMVGFDPPGGTYLRSTPVAVTATNAAGWKLTRWEEDGLTLEATTTNIVEIMDRSKSIRAVFGTKVTVTNATPANGSVSVTPALELYDYGASAVAAAIPSPTRFFTKWNITNNGVVTVSSNNPVAMTVTNANVGMGPVFAPLPPLSHALTVLTIGNGTVDRSTNAPVYGDGTHVVLTPRPGAGSMFVEWTGGVDSKLAPLDFAIPSANTVLAARFTQIPTVSISTPKEGDLVNGATNTWVVPATADDGFVEHVEVYANGTLVGSSQNPLAVQWRAGVPGAFELVAVAVDNYGVRATSAPVHVNVKMPPTIETQPVSQRVAEGSDVAFRVSVGNEGDFVGEWKHNGTNFPGGAYDYVLLQRVTSDADGTYQYFITNEVGSAASDLVTLTVVAPGGLLRSIPLGGFALRPPTIGKDGAIYVSPYGTLESYGSDGTFRWEFSENSNFVRNAPTLGSDETLYDGSDSGQFFALNSKTGAKKWSFDAGSQIWTETAVASDQTLYFGCDNGKVFALSPAGEKLWEFAATNRVEYPLTIGPDGSIYSIAGRTNVFALTAAGRLKWMVTLRENAISMALPGWNGIVYVGHGAGGVVALDSETGIQKWNTLAGIGFIGVAGIGPDGTVYAPDFNTAPGRLFALDGKTGTQKWVSTRFQGMPKGTPAIASNGYIYYFDDQTLRVFDSNAVDPTTPVRSMVLEKNPQSPPILTKDGLIYYTSSEGTVEIVVADAPPADAPWPMFRKTAGNHGNAGGIPGDFRFRTLTENNPSASAAVDASGRVWTAFDARLQEFVGATNFTIGDQWLDNTPVVGASGRIFMATLEFEEPPTTVLKIYDPAVGNFVAVTNVPGVPPDYATLALGQDETMYVGASSDVEGRVYAWNGASEPNLLATLPGFINQAPVIYPDGSLLVSVREMVAGLNQGRLYKIGKDGKTQAKFSLPDVPDQGDAIFGGPIVGGDGTIYIADLFSAIYALDGNLQVEWSKAGADKLGYRIDTAPAIGPDGTVYFAIFVNSMELFAIRPDGSMKWSAPFELEGGATSYSSMAIGADGMIYFGGNDLFFAVRDAGDHGELGWKAPLPGQIYASPLLAPDGNLYFSVTGGQFMSLRASSGPAQSAWPMYRGNAQRTANAQPINNPPTIAISKPAAGAIFTDPANVAIEVAASDDGQVVKVEFFDGDVAIGNSTVAPFSVTLPFAVGNHALKARATDDAGAAAVSGVVNFSVQAAKPAITRAPSSGLFARGATVELSVDATGTGPLQYQWFFNGAALDLKTNATLTIANAQVANSGKYKVRVFNGAGEAVSSDATVTVALLTELRDDVWMPNGWVNAIAVGAEKVYIGGSFSEVGARTGRGALLDFDAGLPDSRFARVDGEIDAVAADGNGGWFIGGTFANVGGVARQRLAHLLAGGILDTNWNVSVQGGAVRTLVRAGGRLYVGGQFASLNNTARAGLAAVTTLGVLEDWTVPVVGSVVTMAANAESVFIGGDFTQVDGKSVANLAKISITSGGGGTGGPKVDDGWNPAPDSPVFAVALNGNRLIVGGQFLRIANADQPRLASIDIGTGAADGWNVRPSAPVRAVAVNGTTIWVGGDFANIGGFAQLFLARLDATTGAVDATWRPALNSSVKALGAFGGRIYVGGQFTVINGERREHAAAFEADGSLAAWNPVTDGDVLAFAFSSDGVFAGGSFSSAGRRARANLAAFDLYTGQVADWNADTDGEVFTLGLNETNLWAGGKFHLAGGVAVSNLVVVDAQAARIVRAAPAVDGPVDSLSVTGKAVYFGGAFGKVNGLTRANLAAYDLGASAMLPWAPVANGEVRTVVLDGSRVYIAGAFSTNNGAQRKKLAAVNVNGTLETWNPGSGDDVFAIAPRGGTVYLGGAFTVIGGQSLNRLAAVDSNLGLANTSFAAGISVSGVNEVRSLFAGAERLLVGGTFLQAGGLPRTNMASFNFDTTPPSIGLDFLPNPDGAVYASVEAGHQVFVGGKFQNISGQAMPYFAILGPSGPPLILEQPLAQSVAAGGPVEFRVEATGQEPLRYQWLADGVPVGGETNATLTISSAGSGDAHVYQVRVTNRRGEALSAQARLNIIADPPHFTDSGTNIIAGAGVTIVLSNPVEGTPPFLFQWRRNGVNIEGATGAELRLENVTAADSGSYTLVARNAFGAEVGPVDQVLVGSSTQQMKGKFGDRAQMINASGIIYGGNEVEEEVEDGEPNPLGKVSHNSQWVAWVAPADGIAHVSTRGSSFDTLLGVYTGSTITGLKAIAEDDDSAGFGNSEVYFNATAGVQYQILVSGFGAEKGDIVLSFELTAGARDLPAIVTQPYGEVVGYGQQATLLVEAQGTGLLFYQWYRNGEALAGQVTATLVVPAVTENEVGAYMVKVSNASHLGVFSQPVRVDVNGTETGGVDAHAVSREKFGDVVQLVSEGGIVKPYKAGLNSPFGAAPARGYSGYQVFDNLSATKQAGEPNSCGVVGSASMWYLVVAETNGTMRVSTEGSNFDTVLAVYQAPENAADWGDLTLQGCDRNSGADHKTSVVEFIASKGVVYQIMVDGENKAKGTVQLHYGIQPTITLQPANQTVFAGGTVTLQVAATAGATYQWLFNGAALPGRTNATLLIAGAQAAHAGRYSAIVQNLAWSLVSSNAVVTVNALPQPQIGSTAIAGGSFQLNLTVTAGVPLIIDRSTNLPTWIPIYTNTPNAPAFLFSEPVQSGPGGAFYRARQ